MRQIDHIDKYLLDTFAVIHYADGGCRLAIKFWHTRWYRWYLMIPPRCGAFVRCIKRDEEKD